MFEQARYAVVNKIDLLPYVPFDVDQAIGFARQVNPSLEFFQTSALTGEGLPAWYDFLRAQVGARAHVTP
jgi:hydrogenase nickel incorporation protein HypB